MAGFTLVDVFGSGLCSGNPLPVIAASEAMSAETMQAITRWFGMSETAFLLPPTDPAADYRVRIFTLDRELPFAGHPTLGSCHAWLRSGGVPRDAGMIVQQCGAGMIRVRKCNDALAFAAPPLLRAGPVDDAMTSTLADFLSVERASIIDAQWIDNGPGWVGVLLSSAADVLAIHPPPSWPDRIEVGVVGPHPPGHPAAYEVRSFFSGAGREIIEDPITGSLNASLAQWLVGSGRFEPPYIAIQGTRLGRDGRVRIERDECDIWIGGQTITIAHGQSSL